MKHLERISAEFKMASQEVMFIEVLPGIHWFGFSEQSGPAEMFVRPQAFFESPNFNGKIFSTQEYMQWYDSTGMPKPYSDFWDSFNLPDWVVSSFRGGAFDPLSPSEQKLLDMTAGLQEPFYVIGSMSDDMTELRHEISHGLFYVNPEYKDRVIDIIDHAGDPEQFSNVLDFLRKTDYAEHVLLDELHAYLMFEIEYLNDSGINTSSFGEISTALRKNFDETVESIKSRS